MKARLSDAGCKLQGLEESQKKRMDSKEGGEFLQKWYRKDE